LSVSATNLLPGSAGTLPVGAVNQDDLLNTNIIDAVGHQAVQLVSQLPNGQLDLQGFDSGYYDSGNEGTLASNLLGQSFPGWCGVDGGLMNHFLSPASTTSPQLPVNIENDVTIQDKMTGAVDYLQFTGQRLTRSATFDYGITGMNIVDSELP